MDIFFPKLQDEGVPWRDLMLTAGQVVAPVQSPRCLMLVCKEAEDFPRARSINGQVNYFLVSLATGERWTDGVAAMHSYHRHPEAHVAFAEKA
jgi:hypothetical protein